MTVGGWAGVFVYGCLIYRSAEHALGATGFAFAVDQAGVGGLPGGLDMALPGDPTQVPATNLRFGAVPGAGKTLVGLNVATLHRKNEARDPAVYLSGNGPLVMVLREALTRDEFNRRKRTGERVSKVQVGTPVKSFIQNVHHFRDEALRSDAPPYDHIAVFDEAQRAWNLEKTAQFMKRRKGVPNFLQSEAEFLISYLDRHSDWAVIVCLVGGGQEIHTGEAGIGAWLEAASSKFPLWELYISDRLTDSEYEAGRALESARDCPTARFEPSLHLAASLRSFRAEGVSGFVKAVLDCDKGRAGKLLAELGDRYPIALTRNLGDAKEWIRDHARGTERYGMGRFC